MCVEGFSTLHMEHMEQGEMQGIAAGSCTWIRTDFGLPDGKNLTEVQRNKRSLLSSAEKFL